LPIATSFLAFIFHKVGVETYLMCGGIFKYELVANLPLSLPEKKNLKGLTFGEVMGKSLVSCFFHSRCNEKKKKEQSYCLIFIYRRDKVVIV